MMVMAVMVMVMMVYDYDHLGLGRDGSQAAKEDQSEQNFFHSARRMRLVDQEPYNEQKTVHLASAKLWGVCSYRFERSGTTSFWHIGSRDAGRRVF